MKPKTRVLIVEDNAALAANLFEFLGEDDYVLDLAPDGLTALHLAASHHYDVIVMDVMLPGLSGFEVCRRLRDDLGCATPILFMTAKDAIEDKVTGFRYGGDDYLVKPFDLRELVLRIEALRRRPGSARASLRAGAISFDPGTLKVGLENHPSLTLSGSAAHLFEALIRAYPKFVSYDALHGTLWPDGEADTHTLRTHVYLLRRQLHDAFGVPLIKTVHGRGYRLVAPGDD